MKTFKQPVTKSKRNLGSQPKLRPQKTDLYRRAEARIASQHRQQPPPPGGMPTETVPPRLLHELQVHQIELEMQNEELRKARDEMEAGLEKYSDLYDFAPVGYLTLDVGGTITEANLAGADMLGVVRAALVGRKFSTFVAPADHAEYAAFQQQVFRRKTKSECDARLLAAGKAPVDVRMQAIGFDSGKACRVALLDITAHKLAEQDIAKKARLLDLSHDAIIVRDMEGHILYWNHGAEELYGWSREEALGKLSHQLLKTEFPTPVKEMLAELYRTERWTGELVHTNRNGRRITVQARKTLDRDNEGKPSAVLENITDITAHKQAEEKVRVSEVRYRRLFEAAHDGVILLDPATRKITDANPFMTKLLGYTHEQLVDKELFEIGLLKDAGASREMFRKLRKSHEIRYENLPLKSRKGRHQEVEVVANLYQEDGHTVIQCNIRDITVRKQAEEALQASQALFSALIAQAPVGVYVVDNRFCLQEANQTAKVVFAKIHPLIGRDFAEVVHILWPAEVARQVVTRFRHTLKTGIPYQSPDFAEKRRDTGAEEVYEWQIQRVTLPAGEHGAVCFFNNITERRKTETVQRRLAIMTASNTKLEAEIVRREAVEKALQKSQTRQTALLAEARQMNAQMQQLSRQVMQAQESERKRISRELHDVIVQTLTGINVQLTSLRKDASHNIKELGQNIIRTQELVEKSVAIVHKFARELRPFALDDLGLIPALHSFMKEYAVRTGVQAELTAFAGVEKLDNSKRTMLFRVVQEALVNVKKHAHASKVEVKIQDRQGVVHLDIADNGRAFNAQKVLQAKQGGRLGLLGMRERVEMVGGEFTVTSVTGKGTTISVQISSGKNRGERW